MSLLKKLTQPLPFHFTYSRYFLRFMSNNASSKPFKVFSTESFVDLRQSGGYYLDKTHFIPEIENLNSPAIISLRPHCFGKTLFLSTLSSYYDIMNKGNRFEQLFGDLYVGKNPTTSASSFYVLNLDFSELHNKTYETFVTLLSKSLSRFYKYYGYRDPTNKGALDKFSSLLVNFKPYVLIDGYDATVNLCLKDETTRIYCKEVNNYLKYACDKGTARIFQIGVIPFGMDFNNLIDLTQKIKFWDLYGFKESDIKFLLNNILGNYLSADVKEGIMSWIKKENDGYLFHRYQIEGVFNPACILYYVERLTEQMKFINEEFYNSQDTSVIIKALLDFSSDPHELFSQTASDLIVNNPLGKSIFTEASSQLESEGIKRQFELNDICKLATDRTSLLSFMFYNGVLTYQSNSLKYKFKIPNDVVKKKFIEEALENYDWNEKDLISVQKYLQVLEANNDIEPLCQFVEQALLKKNDHDSNEGALKQAFIDSLILTFYAYAKPEFWVNFNVNEKTNDLIDLVNVNTGKRIAIECYNIKMEYINLVGLQDGSQEATEISSSLLEKSEDEILKLEVNDPYQPNLKTVGEVLEWKIKKQSEKYLKLLKMQEDKSLKSLFVVLRVGPHRLISRKIENSRV